MSTPQSVGKGSFGKVYKIDSPPGQPPQCIKKINLIESNLTLEFVSKETENWKILDHPNIPKLYSWYYDSPYFVITMEFIEGETLEDLISVTKKSGKLIPENFIFETFKQLVSALKHCKEKSIIHRDLATKNVMIRKSDNVIKLIDFGISRKLSNSDSFAQTFAGTMTTISPEVYKNEGYSFQTDIWSLGVILYELLTLDLPFQFNSQFELMNAIVYGKIKPMIRNCSQILKDVLDGMLIVDPFQRLSIEQIEKLLSNTFLNIIHPSFQILRLDPSFFDPKLIIDYSLVSNCSLGTKIGGFPFLPPQGGLFYGLNVSGKFDNGDDTWLGTQNKPGEWAIAFHGTRINYIKLIIESSLKSGRCNTFGKGIYCCPTVDYAKCYSGNPLIMSTAQGEKSFHYVLMCRVNPANVHYCTDAPCHEDQNPEYTLHITTHQETWFVNAYNANSEVIRVVGIIVFDSDKI